MNPIIYNIRLDTTKTGVQKTLQGIVQGDKKSRKFVISLTSNGKPFLIPDGVTASIYIVKPNVTDTECNNCNVINGNIEYTVLSSDTANVGTVSCQVKLIDSSGNVLCSPQFELEIDDSLVDDTGLSGTNQYTEAETLVLQATEAKTSATASATTAANAADSASNSANDASISAQSASASASTATSKASEASTSATSASASATTASTASTSATASATTATEKASIASASATTATSKASEASASATSASQSATSASASASSALVSKNQAQSAADKAMQATGNLGWYATSTALKTAHPTGSNGQFAVVGQSGADTTDTIWTWDADTSDWVNTKSTGISNYNLLTNLPQVNGVTLNGNKSLDDLGIASKNDMAENNIKTDIASEKVNKIYSGINLLKGATIPVTNNNYNIQDYYLGTKKLVNDKKYTVVLKGKLGVGKEYIGLFNISGSKCPCKLYHSDFKNGIAIKTFTWDGNSNEDYIKLYVSPSTITVNSTIEWVKLVEVQENHIKATVTVEDSHTNEYGSPYPCGISKNIFSPIMDKQWVFAGSASSGYSIQSSTTSTDTKIKNKKFCEVIKVSGISKLFISGDLTAMGYSVMRYGFSAEYPTVGDPLTSCGSKYTNSAITVPSNMNYLVIFTNSDVGSLISTRGTIEDFTEFNIQLESGTAATSFVPYENKIPIISHSTVNLKLANSADDISPTTYSLPTDTAVYAGDSVCNDGTVTHNISKIVFDGTETWNTWGTNYQTQGYVGFYHSITGYKKIEDGGKCYCDLFPFTQTSWGGTCLGINLGVDTSNYIAFGIPTSLLADVSSHQNAVTSFKTWLSNHNVTVCYEKATPTTGQVAQTDVTALDDTNVVYSSNGNVVAHAESFEHSSIVSNGITTIVTESQYPTSIDCTQSPEDVASHTHSSSDITGLTALATLALNNSTSNFLRGDGTWAAPPTSAIPVTSLNNDVDSTYNTNNTTDKKKFNIGNIAFVTGRIEINGTNYNGFNVDVSQIFSGINYGVFLSESITSCKASVTAQTGSYFTVTPTGYSGTTTYFRFLAVGVAK